MYLVYLVQACYQYVGGKKKSEKHFCKGGRSSPWAMLFNDEAELGRRLLFLNLLKWLGSKWLSRLGVLLDNCRPLQVRA